MSLVIAVALVVVRSGWRAGSRTAETDHAATAARYPAGQRPVRRANSSRRRKGRSKTTDRIGSEAAVSASSDMRQVDAVTPDSLSRRPDDRCPRAAEGETDTR